MKTRTLRCTVLASLLAVASAGALAEVKIGFLATMSGSAAALGQDQYDGFMLALEQKGGKLGNVPVKIVKEDDQLKPDLAVQLTQKLIERDKVDLVTGVTFSNVAMAIAKPLEASGTIMISSNAGPAQLAGKGCNANFFFTSFQNDDQAEVLGKYATDQGYKKLMLLAPNYQSGKDQVAGFKRYYKGTVVAEVYTQLNQPDYSAELTQVQAMQPDAIFAFFPGGMGVNFIKQMSQNGLLKKVPLLTVSTVDGTTLPAIKDMAIGTYAGAAWGPDLDTPANQAFVKAFEQKYKRIPSQYAAQAYDSALVIDSALASTKGVASDKAALRAAIRSAQFQSVRPAFKFDTNGFPIQDQYVFQVAKDAQGRVSLKKVASPLPGHRNSYVGECSLK